MTDLSNVLDAGAEDASKVTKSRTKTAHKLADLEPEPKFASDPLSIETKAELGEVAEVLEEQGFNETQISTMSRKQLENLVLGISRDRSVMDNIERDGFVEAVQGDVNPLIAMGVAFKIPPVRAKDPKKVHLFWATLAEKSPYPVERLKRNGCAYASVDDLANGYVEIASESLSAHHIQIEEMVLMKTSMKNWEGLMGYNHHIKPGESQSEIYNRTDESDKKHLVGGMDDKSAKSDTAFNPYNQGSLYGAAQGVKPPKSGSWKHIAG